MVKIMYVTNLSRRSDRDLEEDREGDNKAEDVELHVVISREGCFLGDESHCEATAVVSPVIYTSAYAMVCAPQRTDSDPSLETYDKSSMWI